MRTKNFFKSLAVAAVALVGVFATSCSEEELNVNATGGEQYKPSAAKATVIINVVETGEAGVAAKTIYQTEVDATSSIGKPFEVAYPTNYPDADKYTVPANQNVNIPNVVDGQSAYIPVTFYVVKLTSVYAAIANSEQRDWMYYDESSEIVAEKQAKNESNYGIDYTYEFNVEYGYASVEPITARATSDADLIDQYVQTLLGVTESYTDSYTFVLPPWAETTVTKTQEYTHNKVTYSYNGVSKTYIFKDRWGVIVSEGEIKAIQGHEHAYGHYHTHGYEMNAGGGVTEGI